MSGVKLSQSLMTTMKVEKEQEALQLIKNQM